MLALEDLNELVAPAQRIVRAIPLPSAAEGGSPTAITPPDAEIRALFERVGSVVEVSDREAFDALAAASGITATHFAMAAAVTSWLKDRGVETDAARTYVGRILSGLARTADAAPETSFATLVGEHETRRGLNEQLRLHMAREGALDALEGGLQLLYRRIQNGG